MTPKRLSASLGIGLMMFSGGGLALLRYQGFTHPPAVRSPAPSPSRSRTAAPVARRAVPRSPVVPLVPSATRAPEPPRVAARVQALRATAPPRAYARAQPGAATVLRIAEEHIEVTPLKSADVGEVLSGSLQTLQALRSAIEKIDVPAPAIQLDCDVVELTSSAAHDLGIDVSSPIESASFQTRMFAEIKNGQGRLLSSPRIVSKNGTPVTLIDGDTGVQVQVQPRLNADGLITSHIFTEFSNVTGSVPQVTLRQTATTATAADGQPFIIGGFLRTVQTTNTVRMPLLGYLPLIGWLFRVRHQSTSNTNLYIIITAHVLK